jgi:hypothetical protein
MRARALAASISVVFAIGVGCSDKTPDTVVLQASGGLDGAAFAGDPPVARVDLRVRPQGGSETTVATSDASSGGVDVPDSVRSNGGIGALALVGLDASGSIVAYGRTPDVELAGIDQASLTITILVHRVGAVRRAMKLQRTPTARPLVMPFGPRFVLVADSAKGTLERIDLLTSTAESESLVLAAPATLASAGDTLLSIDAAGNAVILHPGDDQPSPATAPDGTTFADVAGGAVIAGDDDSAYLVGGTRALPSDLVIRLASDGSIAARHMSVARSGGAAAWWPGHGLVLVGGAKVDSSAPPVELLAIGVATGTTLAFPSDGTKGAIVASDGGNKIVRVSAGGVVDVFDLSCSAPPCAPTVQSAKVPGDARVDDAITARDRGGFVVVRGGSISILDAALATITPLGPVGDSLGVALLPTGVTAIVAAGDDVVRTVY